MTFILMGLGLSVTSRLEIYLRYQNKWPCSTLTPDPTFNYRKGTQHALGLILKIPRGSLFKTGVSLCAG